MRMSALSETTGVPVATLKYYLREGLLPSGTPTSRTQAEYGPAHVDRVRLVRALREVAALDVATIRRLLEVVDDPSRQPLDVMAATQRALSGAVDLRCAPDAVEEDVPSAHPRASRLVHDRGWIVDPSDPLLHRLEAALEACDTADLGLDEDRLGRYAAAAEAIAALDLESVPDTDAAATARQVALGTVLMDPVLSTLRRLAQQDAARRAEGAPAQP